MAQLIFLGGGTAAHQKAVDAAGGGDGAARHGSIYGNVVMEAPTEQDSAGG